MKYFTWVLILCILITGIGMFSTVRAAGENATVQDTGAETQTSGNQANKTIKSFSELEHARIGVTTGSIQAAMVEKRFPNAQIFYYNSGPDALNAMLANKIDAIAYVDLPIRFMMKENPELVCLDEYLTEATKIGAIFPKTARGKALCDEFSEFIRKIKGNGVYDEIMDTWLGAGEEKSVIEDLKSLPGPKGTLKMAVDPTFIPVIYVKDGNVVGLEMDIVTRFCKERGYRIEIEQMDFSGIIPSVVTEKADFACAGIAYTQERAESVYYSEFTCESNSVIAVLDRGNASGGGFFASIKESFEKTFIREDRWKLFLSGIATTLLITVLSIVFGTILGYVVFMLCRKGNPVANKITRFFVWLVQGMPMVVLLMILYYVIFGNASISGTAVSVIGFTLVFGAAVYSMLKGAVGAIGPGQTEAAYALGYSDHKAFYRVVLPQALPHFMPSYKGEITALIKATAVVGYVAVQDLTKMGDIVRSVTYESFFPLISVAIIYFVLAALLIFIVNRIEIRIDPRKRTKKHILKGVIVK